MLATRIIPTLLCRGRQLVKGKAFKSWRNVGLVAQAVRIHQATNVDELILLDIGATLENRGPDLDLIKELTANCFMPITVGGGIRSVEDIEYLLAAGADKVAICSAIADIHFLEQMAKRFGCQAIVAAVDYKQTAYGLAAYTNNGTRGRGNAVGWAKQLAAFGAGEILLTCIDREGQMEGYDLDTIREISGAVDIPVIAHGGAGSYLHMLEAIQAGAHAVAAGSLFQFEDCTPRGAAVFLEQHGVEVRLEHVG